MHTLNAQTIRRLMRQNHKTIRGLAREWYLPMIRVRYVRNHGGQGEAFVRDWLYILTLPNVSNRSTFRLAS